MKREQPPVDIEERNRLATKYYDCIGWAIWKLSSRRSIRDAINRVHYEIDELIGYLHIKYLETIEHWMRTRHDGNKATLPGHIFRMVMWNLWTFCDRNGIIRVPSHPLRDRKSRRRRRLARNWPVYFGGRERFFEHPDLLIDDCAADAWMDRENAAFVVQHLLSRLSQRERQEVTERYGDDWPLQKLRRKYKVTRERMRQRTNKTLYKLRRMLLSCRIGSNQKIYWAVESWIESVARMAPTATNGVDLEQMTRDYYNKQLSRLVASRFKQKRQPPVAAIDTEQPILASVS